MKNTTHSPPLLSHEWFRAVIHQFHIDIPPHIQAVFDVSQPIINITQNYFTSQTQHQYKNDGSAFGNADIEIETLLKSHLKKEYPNYYFKGEETDNFTPAHFKNGNHRWLVDPIDGTRNFQYGRDKFAISIALQEFKNKTWDTQDSILLMPLKGEMVWAHKNDGAYILNYNPLIHQTPKIRAINKINDTDTEAPAPLTRTLVDLSTKPFTPAKEGHLIHSIRDLGMTHRTLGSAALAIANVGHKSDGAISLTHDYDVAAGVLIAQESGAILSDIHHRTTADVPLPLIIAATSHHTHNALKNACSSFLTPEA